VGAKEPFERGTFARTTAVSTFSTCRWLVLVVLGFFWRPARTVVAATARPSTVKEADGEDHLVHEVVNNF
jgi:hypothetical protein